MSFLWIILLLALAGCIFALRSGHAWAKPVLGVLALIGAVAGGWRIVKDVSKPSLAEVALQINVEAARALAELAAKEVQEGTVLVLTYAPAADRRIFTDERLDGIRKVFTGTAVKLVAIGPQLFTDKAVADPDFVVVGSETVGPDVSAWLQKNAETKAVISIVPYPPSGLNAGGRPVYAFSLRDIPGWEQAIKAGTWKAIMLNRNSGQAGLQGQTGAWAATYDLVTPENLAEAVNLKPTP